MTEGHNVSGKSEGEEAGGPTGKNPRERQTALTPPLRMFWKTRSPGELGSGQEAFLGWSMRLDPSAAGTAQHQKDPEGASAARPLVGLALVTFWHITHHPKPQASEPRQRLFCPRTRTMGRAQSAAVPAPLGVPG